MTLLMIINVAVPEDQESLEEFARQYVSQRQYRELSVIKPA